MRVLSIVVGILLVLTSVWCFAHPGATFLSIAFLIGFAMFVHSLTAIYDYFSIKKTENTGEGWLLAEGMVAFILSILVLFNQLVADAAIPVFFGMWIIFSGVERIVHSLNSAKKAWWIWTLSLGVVGVMAGIYAFLNSMLADLPAVTVVGMVFLLQGANMIFIGSVAKGKKKRLYR